MGIICCCRQLKECFGQGARVNDRAVESHIRQNPHLLSEQWDIVSFDMTDRAMVCGACEEAGNQCLSQLRAEAEIAGKTAIFLAVAPA